MKNSTGRTLLRACIALCVSNFVYVSAYATPSNLNLIKYSANGEKALVTTSEISPSQNFLRKGFKGTRKGKNLKSVFGIYPRKRILKTESEYYRIFGKVGAGCSGTLVGPAHVLTAAHCVFNQEHKIFYPDLSFAPGQNAEHTPYGKIAWKNVYVPKGYMNDNMRNLDFALIELEESIGLQLGWATIGFEESDAIAKSLRVNITGYPGDKIDKEANTMWSVSCPSMLIHNEYGVAHQCDTFGGMSGSAIYRVQKSAENGEAEKFIFGIHTLGGFIDKDSGTSLPNGGVYISKRIFSILDSWLDGQFTADFTQSEPESPEAINIVAQNNCDFEISIALAYTNLDSGNEVVSKLITVPAGTRKFNKRIAKGDLFVYAQKQGGKALLNQNASTDTFSIANLGDKDFLRIDLSQHQSILAVLPFCQSPTESSQEDNKKVN